jgi:nucleotide-binding universal stress UspA family protein
MSVFPTTILLATDGSREAELAANTAAELSEKTGSELHVVHVGEVPFVYHPELHGGYRVDYERNEAQARELLESQVEKARAAGATVAQAHLKMGRADEEILGLAEGIGVGLIVMGTRGQGGIRRALMGSVSESVVRHAHCPVTIVRE